MELSEKKLSLIERLMRVRNQETLSQVEELLIRAEMESRAYEALDDIAKNETITLNQFNESNQSWIKKRTSK